MAQFKVYLKEGTVHSFEAEYMHSEMKLPLIEFKDDKHKMVAAFAADCIESVRRSR